MKKTFLALTMITAGLFLGSKAHAQNNLSFGVTGNVGHSWMKGDGDNLFKPTLGAGLRLIYSANENIGIGGDLKFSAEGAKKEFSEGATEVRTNLNYIRLNPQFLYFFGEYGQAVRPKIFVGPSLGFLVGGQIKTESGNVTFSNDSKDYYKSFDLGAMVGAGVNFRVAPEKWLNVELGYNHGLLDQSKADNTTAYNRNLALGIGLTWGIGKVKPTDLK